MVEWSDKPDYAACRTAKHSDMSHVQMRTSLHEVTWAFLPRWTKALSAKPLHTDSSIGSVLDLKGITDATQKDI